MSAIIGRRIIAGPAGTINSKFRNKPTVVGDRTFASKREATRYQQLLLLERNGELRSLRCQVVYKLEVAGIHICKYRADFVYEELRNGVWSEITEDVKGYRTPEYKLKKKLMLACFGIDVRET